MLRIGQVESSATADGKYTDGSVAGGIAATRLRAAAFNAIQEELANIVESAGMTLDPDDVTQVLAALKNQFLSRVNPFADIKADGAAAVAAALSNLGLGDAAFGCKNALSFTAPGVVTWTVPDEIKAGRKCWVRVIGAGGSGGIGAVSVGALMGGGGGGGGISEALLDLTGVSTVTLTIGEGGAAVTGVSLNGLSGSSSSFGSYISATGGLAGGQPTGGDGGIGMGGLSNSSLGPGSPGALATSTAGSGGSGGGPGGGGQFRDSAANKAADGKAPGGGGAGLSPIGSNGKSGAGQPGAIYIFW